MPRTGHEGGAAAAAADGAVVAVAQAQETEACACGLDEWMAWIQRIEFGGPVIAGMKLQDLVL